MALSFRTLWLSDIHLGTKASRATELLSFLSTVRAERIYLVGDIIDLERMKVRPVFPNSHMAVVTMLARLGKSGTEVIYIPGNHDAEFRHLVGSDVLGIPIAQEATHVTPNGERWLVMHGDVLDGQIRDGTNLEKFGAAAYKVLTELDVFVNAFRRRLGRDFFSLSASIKRRLSGANEYIRRFETVAAEYAVNRGFDGVVCGHIHRPGIRRIGDCLYMNDGDWVEHATALAETVDGSLHILNWRADTVTDRPVTLAPRPASAA